MILIYNYFIHLFLLSFCIHGYLCAPQSKEEQRSAQMQNPQYSDEVLDEWNKIQYLMPLPSSYSHGDGNNSIGLCEKITSRLNVLNDDDDNSEESQKMLIKAFHRFSRSLKLMLTKKKVLIDTLDDNDNDDDDDDDDDGACLKHIEILVNNGNTEMSLDTNESYSLVIGEDGIVSLKSSTVYGAIWGLQTLKQLLLNKHSHELMNREGLVVDHIPWKITDIPRKSWRGVMLDTSRSFFSIGDIRRTIDGMEFVKLNVLHLHLTDSQSFPIEVKSFPDLTQGYSKEKMYSQNEIQDLIQYAKERGIRVVPEFDTPAHSTTWEGATKQYANITVCNNFQPYDQYCLQPPCGQLNPANNFTYEVLGGVIKEMSALFPDKYFHVGADEPNTNCWNTSSEIQSFMQEQGWDINNESGFEQLNAYFSNRRHDLVISQNKIAVAWDEILHLNPSQSTIIQLWHPEETVFREALDKGHSVVLSPYTHYYLDCGTGNYITQGVSWCNPYKTWFDIYNFTTASRNLTDDEENRILGGEVPIWSEAIDSSNLDTKLWPRAVAAAERFWSPEPSLTSQNAIEFQAFGLKRILIVRETLVRQYGFNAALIQPEWCWLKTRVGFCQNPFL